MGKFGKVIDWIITIWLIIFNIVSGGCLSLFAIAVMFEESVSYTSLWNNFGITVATIVVVNGINFLAKILLRSFKR